MKSLIILLPFAFLLGCKVEEEFNCSAEIVKYQSQEYNTIQIGDQCWLKENLNVGTMIVSLESMKDNGIIEKYCYLNEEDSCTKYGGLYTWNEMMQYTNQQGVRGICPPGWHLPTDEEWKVLEGTADSQYGIGDPEWDKWAYRGYDAGTNLKTTGGWYGNVNGTDLSGFSGLPGGYRKSYGYFDIVGYYGCWWTSTLFSDAGYIAWSRDLIFNSPEVYRSSYGNDYGLSVRCLRDN